MNNFKDLKSTKKGTYGENIIYPIIKAKGWGMFTPNENDNIAHLVDGFIFKMNPNFEFKAIEIKTRPKMNYYDAQGLDNNKIEAYNYLFARGIEIVFFFLDENNGNILTSSYTKMKEESTSLENNKTITYPNANILSKQKITLFSTRTMIRIGKLSIEQCNELKSLSNRSYNYTN